MLKQTDTQIQNILMLSGAIEHVFFSNLKLPKEEVLGGNLALRDYPCQFCYRVFRIILVMALILRLEWLRY